MVRVFVNGPGNLGSIPGRVIPKTQKWYLIPPCLTLSIIRYGSRVKWSNPRKGVVPSPIPWCSSYRKGRLRVTPDYGRQLFLQENKSSSILIIISLSFLTILSVYSRCAKDSKTIECSNNSTLKW